MKINKQPFKACSAVGICLQSDYKTGPFHLSFPSSSSLVEISRISTCTSTRSTQKGLRILSAPILAGLEGNDCNRINHQTFFLQFFFLCLFFRLKMFIKYNRISSSSLYYCSQSPFSHFGIGNKQLFLLLLLLGFNCNISYD